MNSQQDRVDGLVGELAEVRAALVTIQDVQKAQGKAIDFLVKVHKDQEIDRKAKARLMKMIVKFLGYGGAGAGGIGAIVYSILEALGVAK